MEWYQVAIVFGGNITFFLWAIRQSRSDFYHLDKKLDENRKETNSILKAIQDEIKDFHGRLCDLEARERK